MRKAHIVMGALVLLCSCATVEPVKNAPGPIPLAPVDIPSPVAPQVETKRHLVEEPKDLFSFSLKDADVKDVLRGIARQTRYNVVIEPDVKALCTVDLKDVTIDKALEYILEPLGYTFRIEENTIYVSRAKIETRVFPLNYIALKKIGTSFVKGAVTTGGGTSVSGTTGSVSTGTGQVEVLSMESKTESDLWQEVGENLKQFLSKEGKFVVNRLASTIVVIDYPINLKNVAKYVEAITSTVQRQVMIEAKIMEVQLNDSSRQGINWRFISARMGDLHFDNTELVTRSPSTLFPITADTATNTDLPPPYFRFGVSTANFEGFMELLKTQGKINVVSSPRIATLNNQRAVLKVGREDVAFESTTTTYSNSAPTISTAIKYVTIGLMLDVTPQVDDKGNILMNIHPVVTEKVDDATSPKGDATAPVLDVREADTMVSVREGETVVIGGLIKDSKITDRSGIPGLMSMPVVGRFFRMDTEEIVRTELVILLTPRVIYGKDVP
jgi:MSHA biogenesis protein MshL